MPFERYKIDRRFQARYRREVKARQARARTAKRRGMVAGLVASLLLAVLNLAGVLALPWLAVAVLPFVGPVLLAAAEALERRG